MSSWTALSVAAQQAMEAVPRATTFDLDLWRVHPETSFSRDRHPR